MNRRRRGGDEMLRGLLMISTATVGGGFIKVGYLLLDEFSAITAIICGRTVCCK